MTRHLTEVDDLTGDEILAVLDHAEDPNPPPVLAGAGAILLFEKPSARTRSSMELAVTELGGHPVTLRNEEVGIDSRESAEDLARLFSGYGKVIGARVFEHNKIDRLAATASVPVINLLSDEAHPVQTLADLLTIRQAHGHLDGLTVTYVGDANNVARSLAIGCGLVDAKVRISHPAGYGFVGSDVDRILAAGTDLEFIEDPTEAVTGAHVVYTDAWYSMGQESEQRERQERCAPWQVNEQLRSHADPSSVFLHCLPAHRGDEATDGVLDGPASRIWPQAHNRLHSARGLLVWLLGTESSEGGN
jgi:ornithine carbamoyltransferase